MAKLDRSNPTWTYFGKEVSLQAVAGNPDGRLFGVEVLAKDGATIKVSFGTDGFADGLLDQDGAPVHLSQFDINSVH